jgi:hypothetical protein
MRVRSLALCALVAWAAIAIGMLGASAFNPDNGSVAHVEVLWRIFGIGVYLGALALWVLTPHAPNIVAIPAMPITAAHGRLGWARTAIANSAAPVAQRPSKGMGELSPLDQGGASCGS